jgi:uncharacterized membrane protein YjjP (DUF1212 family)
MTKARIMLNATRKSTKEKRGPLALGVFSASCVAMLLAGVIGGMWTVFIAGLVIAAASLFPD